jgi:autotransporter-associated beta strand protein
MVKMSTLLALLVVVTLWEMLNGFCVAETYHWDTNGPSSGRGSSVSPANWLSSSWSTSSSGTGLADSWPNAQPSNSDMAVFAGTAGNVRVNADVFLNALRFETSNYQISSSGGVLHFIGNDPLINTAPSSGNVTISAPLTGSQGLTVTGNSQSGGLKFLILANSDATKSNSLIGRLTIEEGGALRLSGGISNEQLSDAVDLEVAGVLDFVTSGGASDGKYEKVRDVGVTGAFANFSIGNGTTFEVNSVTGTNTSGPGISVNGNSASVPGKLVISGWEHGDGNLSLNNGLIRVNTTSATSAIGGRIVLSGNILSSGNSEVSNKNGGGANIEINNFTHRAFDFTSETHTIDIADGTLKFTSLSISRPLEVTTTYPSGATLIKTGPGIWFWENATQTSFTGTNRIEEGIWQLGASERLADNSRIEIAGGELNLQSFSETVQAVSLNGGSIIGTLSSSLTSATDFHMEVGSVTVPLVGNVGLLKSGPGIVTMSGNNAYSGATTIEEGLLQLNGSHTGSGAIHVATHGVLGGTLITHSNVIVEGSISPGIDIGSMSVGDVEFLDGSVFAVDLTESQVDTLMMNSLSVSEGASLRILTHESFDFGEYVIGQYLTRVGEFKLDAPPGFSVQYDDSQGKIILSVTTPGDFDLNGFVDDDDLLRWQDDYGVNGRSDADGDGDSDGRDFLMWQRHFGAGSSAMSDIGTVPEPNSLTAVTLFLMGISRYRHRQHRVLLKCFNWSLDA